MEVEAQQVRINGKVIWFGRDRKIRGGKMKILLLVTCLILLPSYASAGSQSIANNDIKLACPDGINPSQALVEVSILKDIPKKKGDYIVKGETEHVKAANTYNRCYKILYGKFVYLLDKNHAFFRVNTMRSSFTIPDVLMLIDFGNSIVKNRIFNGIVKGKGLWKYKDGEGIPRSIPWVVVIKEYKK